MATLARNTCNATKWKKIIKSEIGRKVQKVFSKEQLNNKRDALNTRLFGNYYEYEIH